MNETMNPSTSSSLDNPCTSIDACVRENPGRSLLLAAGIGLAIGIAIRVLQTPPPASRAERLLADLQDRLYSLGNRASGLASDGVDLMHDGADRLRGLHLERPLKSLGERVRGLFS